MPETNAFKLSIPSALRKSTNLSIFEANLPAYVQSNFDHMSLVLLWSENDLKQFGSAKVFSQMLVDLKDQEENGKTVGGKTFKGAWYGTADYSLGSISIGGFTENFSHSQYSCRYYEITQSEFIDLQHTPGSYNSAV